MGDENRQNFLKKLITNPIDVNISSSFPKCRRVCELFQNFNIVYFNARSLANKFDALAGLLKKNYYDCVFITETWLNSSHLTSAILDTTEYYMYRSDRINRVGGGVAIIVKRHLTSKIVQLIVDDEQDGFELLAIDYYYSGRNCSRFACVYLPPISSNNPLITTKLVQSVKKLVPKLSLNSNFHIVGDFNLNHVDWTNLVSNSKSKPNRKSFYILKEFLNEHNLTQLISSPTHIDNDTLDIFITSSPLAVLDMHIDEPFTTTCDHYMIDIKLNIFSECVSPKTTGYNFYKADFSAINKFLSLKPWEEILNPSGDLDFLYNAFSTVLHQSISTYIPLRRPKKNRPRLPHHIKLILKEKKKTYKQMKRNPSLKEKYKSLDKIYRKSIINFSRNHEEKLMRSRNKNMFHSYVKSKLKSPSHIPPLLNASGTVILDSKEKANTLNSLFSKIFQKDIDSTMPDLPDFGSTFNTMPDFKITPKDVEFAISNLKNTVSRTPDHIPSLYIKKNSKALAKPLSILFNKSLETGKIPSIWKEALVVPVFKKGRRDDPGNYRPISLTSVVCRLLERIIHHKISEHLLQNDLLSKIQHGFISRRSTLTQHISFFDQLTKFKCEKENCDAIYLDFTKAFDIISHKKLIHVLTHYKINKKLLQWIEDFLNKRTQRTVVENESSDYCSVTSGVPQGSVLGPLFFVLYIESLIKTLEASCRNTSIYAFADDVKLLGSNPSELQYALSIVENWANKWGLCIQPKKSEHLSFVHSRSAHQIPTFSISNYQIPQCETVKDLGITLSKDHKWTPHIYRITSRANIISYNILKTFLSKDHRIYINLYKTHIRPILEYNTVIWTPHLITDIRKAESIQRRFTRRLCQKTNTRYNNYEHRLEILNLDTLEIRRVKFDLIIMYKIYHNIIDINYTDLFLDDIASTNYNLRGHKNKIQPQKYSGSTIRHSFFCNRIINLWNKLPEHIINSITLQNFKTRLNQFKITDIYTSKL